MLLPLQQTSGANAEVEPEASAPASLEVFAALNVNRERMNIILERARCASHDLYLASLVEPEPLLLEEFFHLFVRLATGRSVE